MKGVSLAGCAQPVPFEENLKDIDITLNNALK